MACEHDPSGALSEMEMDQYATGDQCVHCGMTVGEDQSWYIDRDQAPGYPFTTAEADKHAGTWE